MPKKNRIGNQQPTQSVTLPYRQSPYKDAVALYELSARKAQKWQADLLKNILAKNKQGLWVHTKYGYSVPRRNGKNEVVAAREMYGLKTGEKILHTAHRTTTSHAAWERLCALLDKAKIEYTSLRASGRECVELAGGGRADFRTRSTKGGLGEGFDLLIIDEAQEYTTDQESALKYVVTDSKNPQTIFCGTPPTPLSSGTAAMEFDVVFTANTEVTNPSFYHVERGTYIKINKVLAAGEKVTVSTVYGRKGVTLQRADGTTENGFRYLDIGSDLAMQIDPGDNTIRADAENNREGLLVQVIMPKGTVPGL